ncbi:uncharacterized protein F5147DRAFT_248087 [Suillus discolor]|uniref:Uncharacterized protein n=1 Tax=Suillus discolor TaxID=1912936 RepID=A0A9P7JZ84_9AGAM|nr:uncharacterized protein F5147DRAFT_248087 [Suillus discolor]KAG2117783.1 hypothetical protein F5147DRAFT_248087 [Suillus discolor]
MASTAAWLAPPSWIELIENPVSGVWWVILNSSQSIWRSYAIPDRYNPSNVSILEDSTTRSAMRSNGCLANATGRRCRTVPLATTFSHCTAGQFFENRNR